MRRMWLDPRRLPGSSRSTLPLFSVRVLRARQATLYPASRGAVFRGASSHPCSPTQDRLTRNRLRVRNKGGRCQPRIDRSDIERSSFATACLAVDRFARSGSLVLESSLSSGNVPFYCNLGDVHIIGDFRVRVPTSMRDIDLSGSPAHRIQ